MLRYMNSSETLPVAIITGATSGIGSAIARTLIDDGYRVVLGGRAEDAGRALSAELGGHRAIAVRCDVTEWPDVQRLTAAALERFARLDVVVANAGVTQGPRSFLGEEDPEGWDSTVRTNLLGTALTARAALPSLVASRGRLVIIGSVLGRYTMSGSLYAATKAGVAGLAEAIRLELIGTGVSVNLIAPGPVDTTFAGARPGAGSATLATDDVVRAVRFVIDQPTGVDVNEILIRPHGATP